MSALNYKDLDKAKTVKSKKIDFYKLTLIFPISLWMILLVAIPLTYVVVISFMQRGAEGGINFVFSFENYKRMIKPLYFKVFFDSLGIAAITTFLTFLFGYPFAYFLSKTPKKLRIFALMMIIIPFWTNSLIRTYAWMALLSTEGLINHILLNLGLIKEPLKLLYTYGAVLIGMVYTLFPFMVLPLYNSIEKVDKSLVEAAKDLGANSLKTFTTVTLPLTMPGIIAGCILVFIPSLGLFFIPDLMGGSNIMLIGNLIRNQFLVSRDWPFGAALSIVLIIVALILIGICRKLTGKKVDVEVF
ncbi:spermidine/putrescine ABC transporter permease [Clostridium carboxidivorans P7]|uniref:Binding-protein-dependent transport systems inner membrane component n=1 Tax=Clostridium carboxidivorans P7 TaxID=536227 RepID=C6Q0Y8_9CLOT|nr:ABC transporter permease [Clostridium carboxidivorans]AKN32244.1 spermidine/putrescine ABC transporter permease [Clostridium carboxidivorans P7]EET84833.1 binding-protein-dependent transport systems inner membrane component [Clostridium carboxidivorans P7]